MVHERPDDALLETLSLYVLGLLEGKEAEDVEAHLDSGCAVCRREARELREAVALIGTAAAVPPPAGLRDKVLAPASPQVWKQWAQPAGSDLHAVRSGEGEWATIRPGVHVKQLYVDETRDLVTMLIRMDAGARYVPHRHKAPEQCFVLEGDIRDEDGVFHAGDFQCKAPGSVHGAQTTEKGCLLLIVSSREDELL
jgi:anti-sigma factor ChrR (cupin superfamily)